MKYAISICLLLLSITLAAQNPKLDQKESRKELKERRSDFTPSQMAELQTKRMALRLDLSEQQQAQIQSLLTESITAQRAKASNRKDLKDLSSTEKYELKSDRLDAQLALKNKMKDILTEDQYARFEQSLANRKRNKRGRTRGNR